MQYVQKPQQTVKTLYPLSPLYSLSSNIKHTAERKHTHSRPHCLHVHNMHIRTRNMHVQSVPLTCEHKLVGTASCSEPCIV